jgi:hypothetical protein
MYQLAAHVLSIATAVMVVSLFADWRNSSVGYWLNLCVAGGTDGVWVLVVVLPGYVSVSRGLLPPTLFVAGAIATTIARRIEWRPQLHGKHEEATMRSLSLIGWMRRSRVIDRSDRRDTRTANSLHRNQIGS